MYSYSSNIDRKVVVRHYVGLSLKTVLAYFVFIICFFSVPVIQWFIDQVEAIQVERGIIGETAITIEIVNDYEERILGLSGRESIPENHAMLFVFPDNDYHGIWMKDMNFPIDIIWLNEFSEVTHMKENVSPDTFPKVFRPTKKTRFILEFNAGFIKENSIKLRDRLVLP